MVLYNLPTLMESNRSMREDWKKPYREESVLFETMVFYLHMLQFAINFMVGGANIFSPER